MWSVADGTSGPPIVTGLHDPVYEFDSAGNVVCDVRGGFAVFDAKGKALAKAAFRGSDQYLLGAGQVNGWVVIGDTSENDSGLYLWNWKSSKKFVHVPLGQQISRFVKSWTTNTIFYQTLEFDPKEGLATSVCSVDVATHKRASLYRLVTGNQMASYFWFDPKGTQIVLQHFPGKPTRLWVKQPGVAAMPLFTAGPDAELDVQADGSGKVVVAIGDDGIVRSWQL